MQAHLKALQVYLDKMYQIPETLMETYEIPGLGELEFDVETIKGSARYFAKVNGTDITPYHEDYSKMKEEALFYGLSVLKSNRKKTNKRLLNLERIDYKLMEKAEEFNRGIMRIIELSDSIIKSGATQ